jgi:hypothetical protein
MKEFKFLNKEYNYDGFVIRYINNHMRNDLVWRGTYDMVEEDGEYYRLVIQSGMKMGGMYHIEYFIVRGHELTNYRFSVPASQIENPFE